MLKPDQIEPFKAGVTLKICAGHYNEDLRLYPRDKTPKSDHPPYPVTEEEIKDYWNKVATFGSSTVSAPIRATAPKPSHPRPSSDNLTKLKVHRGPGRPAKPRPQIVQYADLLGYDRESPLSPMYDWESGALAMSSATEKELFELDHSPVSSSAVSFHDAPTPASKQHQRNVAFRDSTTDEAEVSPSEEEHTISQLGKRKRPHLSLELSKIQPKRRQVRLESNLINVAEISTRTQPPLPSDKFVPNITLTFNLSNDPSMKYSLGIVADKDYDGDSYTSFRLRSEVIYVETDRDRFELSWSGSRPATLPTTPVGASTTRKDVMLDTYRWVRVLNPRQLDSSAMAQLDVPLPADYIEVIEDDLDWSEIEWGPNTIRVRSNEYRLRSIQFFKIRSLNNPNFGRDYDDLNDGADDEHDETSSLEEEDYFPDDIDVTPMLQLQSAR